MNFYNILITWYLANKRDLPWRKTQNPYHIWLSEIILQQTRVAQGLPYYNAFIKQFPKVSDLANASQEQVLKLWQGLGYYSRARNLHDTAKYIYNDLNSEFPDNYNELLKLKGVGSYTAAAIASFAYKEQIAVVDGNVFRVLARIFDINDDISTIKTKNKFQKLANELLFEEKKSDSSLFNQAIMDFGATQCVPKSPNCNSCPFNTICLAFINNNVKSLPIKLKKTKIKKRYFDYVIVRGENDKYKINKRQNGDIWEGLHEFDLIENDTLIDIETIEKNIKKIYEDYPITELVCFDENFQLHKLSHQHLYLRFWKLEINIAVNGVFKKAIENYSYSIVISNFIKNNYDKI